MGPIPKALVNRRWLCVGTDYFIKWVEIEPLSNIRDMDARRFVWRNISLGLGSLTPSSQTMVFSLIVKPLGGTVVIWALRIGTPPRLSIGEWVGRDC